MIYVRRILLLLFLALFSLSGHAYAEDSSKESISVKEAQKIMKEKNKELLILDVRTPGEYAEGHIPHARNMDFFGPVFERDINRLDRDKPILVYCKTGRRSDAAADMLAKAGFKKIYDLKGGIKAWQKENLPIEADASR